MILKILDFSFFSKIDFILISIPSYLLIVFTMVDLVGYFLSNTQEKKYKNSKILLLKISLSRIYYLPQTILIASLLTSNTSISIEENKNLKNNLWLKMSFLSLIFVTCLLKSLIFYYLVLTPLKTLISQKKSEDYKSISSLKKTDF